MLTPSFKISQLNPVQDDKYLSYLTYNNNDF